MIRKKIFFLCTIILFIFPYIRTEIIRETKKINFKHPIKVYSHSVYLRQTLRLPLSNKLKIYGYADNLEKSQPYLLSAKKFNVPLTDLFYSDYPVGILIKKFYTLRYVIDDLPDDTLIMFTDVFDVLFVHSADFFIKKFKSLNCNLLIGGERWYSHQVRDLRPFYDKMFASKEARYINSGFFIGYCWIIKIMLNKCIKWFEEGRYYSNTEGVYCDQTMLGIFFYEYNKIYNLKVDTDQSIVWNIVPDSYQSYYKCTYNRGKLFYNGVRELGVVHIPGKQFIWGTLGTAIFKDIQEKTY